MAYQEFTGKSVDEALTEALVALGLTSDQIEYEVIEKGGGGFLGFNAKPAKIRVCKKGEAGETAAESSRKEAKPVATDGAGANIEKTDLERTIAEETVDQAAESAPASAEEIAVVDRAAQEATIRDFLSQVCKAMHMDIEVLFHPIEEENMISVELKGNDMGVLIGKRGQTLDALQYLTNLALNKHSERYTKIKLDTENYRERRKETLENLARNLASKAKRMGQDVELEPMNPFERRVIHFALQGDPSVETYSVGDEPYRYVVITQKK